MAIFKSAFLGNLRRSIDELTMYELNGQNIVRSKNYPRDSRSPRQLAQRARMKAVRKLSYQLAEAILYGYPGQNRTIQLNRFVQRNIASMNPDENQEVSYDRTQIKLSSGELAAPSVTALIDREHASVTFTQQRQPLRPLAPDDDRVYGVVWGRDSEETEVFELKCRGESGSTTVTLQKDTLDYPLEVYAFTVSRNGKKSGETIWVTGEEENKKPEGTGEEGGPAC